MIPLIASCVSSIQYIVVVTICERDSAVLTRGTLNAKVEFCTIFCPLVIKERKSKFVGQKIFGDFDEG